MTKQSKPEPAFTLVELVVVLAIIAILVSLMIPAGTHDMIRGQETQTVNNARQIYLATFNMATDGLVSGEERLGWPGDLRDAKSPPNRVTSVSGFMNRVMEYEYLKPTDVIKVTAAPGIAPWQGTPGTFDGDKNCAFKIYTAGAKDGESTIFLATQNFTYGKPLDPYKQPYRDKSFIVMRKGGDGAALKPKQTQSLPVLGLLPGRTNYEEGFEETPADTLIQR